MAAPKLIDHPRGHPLFARCNRCRHSAELDVAWLAEHLGGETSFDELRTRLRCTWCGARDVTTICGSGWR